MKRRGSMLVELTIAVTVLGVAIAVCVELVGLAITQRRSNADRQLAAQEAANLMERLSAMPMAELRSEKAKALSVSPEGKCLQNVKPEIEITDAEGDPKAVRVAVSIQWEDRSGQPLPPVRLVAWRYR